MHRMVLACGLLLVAAAPAAAQSPGATSISYDANAGVTVTGTSQRNTVRVRLDGRLAVLERLSDGLLVQPSTGCAAKDAGVACELLSTGRLSFHGFGGDDILDAAAYPFGVVVEGGAGDDRITGGGSADLLRGGLGNDAITASTRRSVTPDVDADGRYVLDDTVEGQDGNDSVDARDGEADDVSCGAGADTAVLDLRDRHRGGCESIDRSDRREGPNVAVVSKRVRVRRRVAGIVLRCPRGLGRLGCRGTLQLGERGRPSRYGIRSGRRRTVRVTVAPAERFRRTLRLTSVERGRHGPKTTVRVLRIG